MRTLKIESIPNGKKPKISKKSNFPQKNLGTLVINSRTDQTVREQYVYCVIKFSKLTSQSNLRNHEINQHFPQHLSYLEHIQSDSEPNSQETS